MQMMAQQAEKERKKHKSLWEDEEEITSEDPTEIADNTEYSGTLPDIDFISYNDFFISFYYFLLVLFFFISFYYFLLLFQ